MKIITHSVPLTPAADIAERELVLVTESRRQGISAAAGHGRRT
jgi:hypothetical protein